MNEDLAGVVNDVCVPAIVAHVLLPRCIECSARPYASGLVVLIVSSEQETNNAGNAVNAEMLETCANRETPGSRTREQGVVYTHATSVNCWSG